MMSIFSSLLAVAAAISGSDGHSHDGQPTHSEDGIVVRGTTTGPGPLPDAATYFQRHCFDRQRKRKSHISINDDYDWQLLPTEWREQWGVNASVPAFYLHDPARDHTLIVKFETITNDSGLIDQLCTMIVIGGSDHTELKEGLSDMMRGSPASTHVDRLEGFEDIPGWDQWIWTATANRGSEQWETFRIPRKRPSYLVVTDPRYFRGKDYVLLDLKSRDEGPSELSVIRLLHRSRDVPETPLGE